MIPADKVHQIKSIITEAKHIAVVQADNPDGDSLASSLALESLLGAIDKKTTLYCAIDIPEYLRYLPGWDRVTNELPSDVDTFIIVDCGFWRLLTIFETNYGRARFEQSQSIILDHHQDSAHDVKVTVDLNQEQDVAAAQVVYELAEQLNWAINADNGYFIAAGILADTLGLTSEVLRSNSRPFTIMADLVEKGVDVSELQQARLDSQKISRETLAYKAELLQRVEYYDDGKIASITIPYEEIREHSQKFNPVVILDELRNVEGVAITIGFKLYEKNNNIVKVTGRIRCNRGYLIALKLAEVFDHGGGHAFASGFKIEEPNINFQEVKSKCISNAIRLLHEAENAK